MRRSVLAMMALLALCVPTSFGQTIKDPAEVMPAGVLAYAEVRQPGVCFKEFVSLFENSYLADVPHSLFKLMEEMKVPPPPHGFRELGGVGLLLSPEIVKEAQRLQGMAAAITGIDRDGQPEFVVVGRPGESNLPRLMFRALLTMERIKPAGKVEGVTLYRPFHRVGQEMTEHGPALAMLPDALIVGSPNLVENVIERIKGKNKAASLASVESYREANKQIGPEAGVFSFVNIAEGLNFLGRLPFIGEGEKEGLKLIAGLRAQAYSLALDKGRLRFREVVLLDPKETGIFDLLPSEPVKRELLHFTPNDGLLALAMSNADGAKRCAKALEMLDRVAKISGAPKVPSEEVGNFFKALELDMGKDVMARINAIGAALGDPSKAPMKRVEEKGKDFERFSEFPEVPGVLIIEATDEDAATKLLEDVLPKVHGLLANQRGYKAATKEMHGQKVHTLPVNKFVSLNYGRQGRTIVLGPFAAPVAQALNNGTKKQGLLGEEKVAAGLKEIESPLVLGVARPFTLIKAGLMTAAFGGESRKAAPQPDRAPAPPPERRRDAVRDEKAAQPDHKREEAAFMKELDRALADDGLIVLSVTRQKDRIMEDITWTGLKPGVARLTDLAFKWYLHERPAVAPPKAVPRGDVSGRATFRGKPLPSGSVTFHYDNGLSVSTAIAPDGSYSLRNVPAGEAHVCIKGGKGQAAVRIPEKYADPKTTDLRFNVQAGEQTIDIDLR